VNSIANKKTVVKSEIISRSFFKLAKELFTFSLVLYLILLFSETIFPGFVSNNFNLDWVLGIVLLSGIIAAFDPEKLKKKNLKKTKNKKNLGNSVIFHPFNDLKQDEKI